LLAFLLATTNANAGTIELGVSPNFPLFPITVIASGTNSASVSGASFGDFFFSGSGNSSAAASGLPLKATLSAIDTIPRPGAIQFFVTETGLTPSLLPIGLQGALLQRFDLNFTADQVSSNLWHLDEVAFIDPNNQPFGLTLAFENPGFGFDHPATFADNVFRDPSQLGPGPYSMTELLVISNIFGIQGIAGGSIEISSPVAAVPGPIAGAGLPGLILAGGVLLLLVRRRRQRTA
jgi:hypothetical protein